MADLINKLQTKLGYFFSNPALLEQALTHRSFAAVNNERLEFLGDAVLELIVSQALFLKFPSAEEGQLTRLRAALVRKEALAARARELGLGTFLMMGQGENNSGGRHRDSILADAFEAITGAIYLDAGFDTVSLRVGAWLQGPVDALSLEATEKDAKTQLQEYLQAQSLALPVYQVQRIEGASHSQIFTVNCNCTLLDKPETAQGRSRRTAEQRAAQQVLLILLNKTA
tara:strand:- start:114 stop:797 length:684 start_codon:yes stop_codon:yes gene_type:complete